VLKQACALSAASHPRSSSSSSSSSSFSFIKKLTKRNLLQCTFLATEWFWAFSKVCEMPEALHPTHDSQVG